MTNAAGQATLDIYQLSALRALLAAQGVRLKQSLGQNFLHDRNVAAKIVRTAGIMRHDTILEIGAGIGHLTLALAQTGARIVAVETDARLLPLLRENTRPHANVTVVHADIMAQPLISLYRHCDIQPDAIVGNLPYYITTPIVEQIVTSGLALRSATFTLQHEAAERLSARPGQRGYGATAVLVHLWGSPHCGATIAPACFFPRPAVSSCTLHLCAHQPPQVPAPLWQPVAHIVQHAFNQRRKTLANALTSLCPDARARAEWLAAAHLDGAARAEHVPPAAFVQLAASHLAHTDVAASAGMRA